MGNRTFQETFLSLQYKPVFLEGNFVVGATGAVGVLEGGGIASVTRLAAGTYQINLQDSYPRFLGGKIFFESPTTGSPVADGSLVIGTTYQITVVGTTLWNSYGLPAGVVPAVGQAFVATSIGGAGTGTATAVGKAGTLVAEFIGEPQATVNQQTNPYIAFQCVNSANAVADPVATSSCDFILFLRNSSVKGRGE